MNNQVVFSATEISKLPAEPYFMILQDETLTYDDGYGSTRTDKNLGCTVCLNIEAVEHWIRQQEESMRQPKPYRMVKVSPVEVVKQVSFRFEQ
jgi:hypothetical protein